VQRVLDEAATRVKSFERFIWLTGPIALIEQSRGAEYDRPACQGNRQTLGNVRRLEATSSACIDNETRLLSLTSALRVNSGRRMLRN
jgi:hypothetical protein